MAFITADRVKDTSTTTGTGNITVSGSAPFGYRTFSTVLSVSDTFYYCIQGQGTSEWEVGLGTYVSSNQFARTTVLSSSASGSAVSFSSGTKNVFITLAADKTLQIGPSSSVTVPTVIGGTTASSSLTLQSTSGVGTSDSILFKVGNNGATTALTIDTSGNVLTGLAPTPTSGANTYRNIVISNDIANGSLLIGTNSSFLGRQSSDGSTILNTGQANIIFSRGVYGSTTTSMTINSSGNVGIGQASINAQTRLAVAGANTVTDARGILSVNSTSAATTNFGGSISLGGEGGGGTTPYVFGSIAGRYEGSAYSGYLQFSTTNSLATVTERMRIDSSGNVGIGATSPSAKLHSYATSGTTTTLGRFEAAIGSYTGTSLIAANTLSASSTYNLFSCITDSDGDAGGPFTQFLVRGDGNVGIGTSSPGYVLDVNKNSATNSIRIGSYQDTSKQWLLDNTNGGFTINGSGATSSTFMVNVSGSERMRIDSSGNVGIGATANASAILDAQSTTKGVRFPNMTTTQKNAVSSPAAGLVVFDTTLAKLCVYSGAAWQTITSV